MLAFLVEGLYQMIGEGLKFFFDSIISSLNMNGNPFVGAFPVLSTIFSALTVIGWSVLGVVLVFFVYQSIMTPNSQNAEHPFNLLCRAVLAGSILALSGYIKDVFMDFGSAIYDALSSIDITSGPPKSLGEALIGPFLEGGAVSGVMQAAGLLSGVSSLFLLIMLIAISWQIIKFMLELLERYVTFCFSGYLMPLVAPTLVSKATAGIFSAYMSFVVAQMLLMWLSVIFMKIIIAGFMSMGTTGSPSWFLHCFLLYSMTILAQKADNILARIGFRNVLGHAGVVSSFMAGTMLLGSAIKAVAKSTMASGRSGGGTPRNPSTTGGENIPPMDRHGRASASNDSVSIPRNNPSPIQGTASTPSGTAGKTPVVTTLHSKNPFGSMTPTAQKTMKGQFEQSAKAFSDKANTETPGSKEAKIYSNMSRAQSAYSMAAEQAYNNDLNGSTISMNEGNAYIQDLANSYADTIAAGGDVSAFENTGITIDASTGTWEFTNPANNEITAGGSLENPYRAMSVEQVNDIVRSNGAMSAKYISKAETATGHAKEAYIHMSNAGASIAQSASNRTTSPTVSAEQYRKAQTEVRAAVAAVHKAGGQVEGIQGLTTKTYGNRIKYTQEMPGGLKIEGMINLKPKKHSSPSKKKK